MLTDPSHNLCSMHNKDVNSHLTLQPVTMHFLPFGVAWRERKLQIFIVFPSPLTSNTVHLLQVFVNVHGARAGAMSCSMGLVGSKCSVCPVPT